MLPCHLKMLVEVLVAVWIDVIRNLVFFIAVLKNMGVQRMIMINGNLFKVKIKVKHVISPENHENEKFSDSSQSEPLNLLMEYR